MGELERLGDPWLTCSGRLRELVPTGPAPGGIDPVWGGGHQLWWLLELLENLRAYERSELYYALQEGYVRAMPSKRDPVRQTGVREMAWT